MHIRGCTWGTTQWKAIWNLTDKQYYNRATEPLHLILGVCFTPKIRCNGLGLQNNGMTRYNYSYMLIKVHNRHSSEANSSTSLRFAGCLLSSASIRSFHRYYKRQPQNGPMFVGDLATVRFVFFSWGASFFFVTEQTALIFFNLSKRHTLVIL